MKVEITRDTIVRVKKGAVIDVSEEEAKRLISFKNAKKHEVKRKK